MYMSCFLKIPIDLFTTAILASNNLINIVFFSVILVKALFLSDAALISHQKGSVTLKGT